MEPPCEHGGVREMSTQLGGVAAASMEPPCEHGGVSGQSAATIRISMLLQWSRRVNTAECWDGADYAGRHKMLQWSRRVNTAECPPSALGPIIDHMLQWSRRVNTAE